MLLYAYFACLVLTHVNTFVPLVMNAMCYTEENKSQRYWERAACLPRAINVNIRAQVCNNPLVSQLFETVNHTLLPMHQNSEAC